MKHFLSTKHVTHSEAVELLDTTLEMDDVRKRDVKKLPTLRGKTVANVFFEDSTRTRLSFEAAALALSADIATFTAAGSSTSKGESIKDTLQTLEAMGADFIVLRHPQSGAADTVVANDWVSSRIINAGDGTHEHPTQALLDAFTIRNRFHGSDPRGKDLSGISVVIVGDILHSRVARSNLWLLKTLGADVSVTGPRTLLPAGVEDWGVRTFDTLDDALHTQPNVVMTLRIQRERMQGGFFPSESEYANLWGMTADRLDGLSPETIVMHPGPMNRGVEIAGSVADSTQSTVREQVSHGVSARMAVLYHLMGAQQ